MVSSVVSAAPVATVAMVVPGVPVARRPVVLRVLRGRWVWRPVVVLLVGAVGAAMGLAPRVWLMAVPVVTRVPVVSVVPAARRVPGPMPPMVVRALWVVPAGPGARVRPVPRVRPGRRDRLTVVMVVSVARLVRAAMVVPAGLVVRVPVVGPRV
jgi:hypothetical protein